MANQILSNTPGPIQSNPTNMGVINVVSNLSSVFFEGKCTGYIQGMSLYGQKYYLGVFV